MSSRVTPRRLAAIAASGVLLVALVSGASAARPTPALPGAIPARERERALRIAEEADVSTRVDAEPFVMRARVFEYLIDHPDFASRVSRVVRAARYRIDRTPDGMTLDDGWGVTGKFWVIYAANGTRVMRARGEYRSALAPTIEGDAITMVEYAMTPRGDGRSIVQSRVTGYVKLDSRVASFAIKLASSVAQRKADLEARRLMKVFAKVSQRLEEDPTGVVERLRQQPDVAADRVDEFARLLTGR